MTSRLLCPVSRVLRWAVLLAFTSFTPIALLCPAHAATITIADARTTGLQTATIDGGNPGDLVVSSTGSVTLTSGTAITLNSPNNTVEQSGTVRISDVDNAIGYSISPGISGGFTHFGTLELGTSNTDPAFPFANNKRGLILNSGGTFTGNISIKSTNFTVRGDASVGIDLQGSLAGNLDMTGGGVVVQGKNSQAIRIAAPVTGNVLNNSMVVVGKDGSSGLVILAPVSGKVIQSGSVAVTGYDDLIPDAVGEAGNDNATQKTQQSGPAIAVGANIGNGLLINGPSPEEKAAVVAGTKTQAEITPTAAIAVQSSSAAILISPSVSGVPSDVTLGVVGTGDLAYGFVQRGNIGVNSIYEGNASEAVRIQGATISSVDYRAILTGGLRNDGNIETVANTNNSTAVIIGNLATVPTILNTGMFKAGASGDGNFSATALLLQAGADAQTLINSGSILAAYAGDTGEAVAIRDLSGQLTSITNTGVISAQVGPLDDGDAATDDTPTGAHLAADFSATSNDITFINELPAGADPATATTGQIIGDVRFGSGADKFQINSGKVTGNTSFGAGADWFNIAGGAVAGSADFGAGADTLSISNGGTMAGQITDSDGQLTIDIQKGSLFLLSTTPLAITSATLGPEATLGIGIDTNTGTISGLDASGVISIASGAKLVPGLQGPLVQSVSGVILSASDLQIAGDPNALMDVNTLPFIYEADLIQGTSGLDETLTLTLNRKTPAELGMIPKLGVAYDPMLVALPADQALETQFLALNSQAEFNEAYIQFMPSYTDAMLAMAKKSTESSARQIRQRLEDALISGSGGGAWASETIYTLERRSNPGERSYDAQGAVLNLGLDDHLTRDIILGLAVGLDHGDYIEDGDLDDPVSVRRWTGGFYGGGRAGNFLLSGSLLGALSDELVVRNVVVGNAARQTQAEWTGWRYSADLAASYFTPMGRLYLLPTIGANFLHIYNDGYTEEGGSDPASTAATPGNAIALQVDSRTADSLSTFAELIVGYNLLGRQQILPYSEGQPYILRPELRLGVRHDFISDPIDTRAKFVSDTQWFTIPSDQRDETNFTAGLGLVFVTRFGSLGINGDGVFGENTTAFVGKLDAAFRF